MRFCNTQSVRGCTGRVLAGMLYNSPVTLRSIALLSASLAPSRDLRLCPTPESPEEKKEAEAAIEADAEGG